MRQEIREREGVLWERRLGLRVQGERDGRCGAEVLSDEGVEEEENV